MGIALLLTAYCALITAASMVGGWLPQLVRMTHLRTQLLISFVAGLMLSIATVQLLPHSIEQLGSASWTGMAVLLGILAMFVMLRAFHVHPHVASPLSVHPQNDHQRDRGASQEASKSGALGLPVVDAAGVAHGGCSGHGHHHEHHHEHEHGHHGEVSGRKGGEAPRGMTWVGMIFGLGIHSLMDGVALASSVAADAGHGAWLGLYGLGTFLAICLHKPLDAFAITSTMQASGWPERHRRWVNLGFSTISPLGAMLFWVGASRLGMTSSVIGLGLAISAGFFICIALADLLPEVHFHSHDRLSLTAVLLLGVAIAIAIENLPGHDHEQRDQREQHEQRESAPHLQPVPLPSPVG